MSNPDEELHILRFKQGLNNVARETAVPKDSLQEAVNVDIDDTGIIRNRRGFLQIYAGTNIHSLFHRYFVESGILKYLNTDNTVTTLAQVNPEHMVSYCEFNNRVYFSDGYKNGYLEGPNYFPLSVETPTALPSMSVNVYGSLQIGSYQVTIAFVNRVTSEMSGAVAPAKIDVDSVGAIALENIPQPDDGFLDIAVYATTPNGTKLYKQATLPRGTTSFTIPSVRQNNKICDTLYLTPMPAGCTMDYYRGRLFIGHGNSVYYSNSRRYGLTRASSNFYQFPEPVTMCLSVETGLFISSDKIYFMKFTSANDPQVVEVYQEKAVPGTALHVDGNDFGMESTTQAVYWFSETGPVLGLQSGQVRPLTDNVLAPPNNVQSTGASMYTEQNGIKQVVTSMPSSGPASTLESADGASLTIIRNGVVI